MAFPRQPLLFTETVPHNSYETVEGNHKAFDNTYDVINDVPRICWCNVVPRISDRFFKRFHE